MINVIDTSSDIFLSYEKGEFVIDKWKEYIDGFSPAIKPLCLSDMQECVSENYSWEEFFLPVLNDVFCRKSEVENLSKCFHKVVDGLDERITAKFGKSPDVDIILYLGLCNGAGWVTDINGKISILLGIEKILELNWNSVDDLNGLILHEIGHVYQARYGVLHRKYPDTADVFLWQLFTEGVAMIFEQEIIGDSDYYHQDKNGWGNWCNMNLPAIVHDFSMDQYSMTRDTQRYFGDWTNYNNHSDVGYYLGTRFLRNILKKDTFDNIINYEIKTVREYYDEFASQF